MTSSLSSLPLELVEEIFVRVPIESLVRFKTTSKEWYAFFSHKKFIYKHLDLSQERFIRVDVGHQSLQIFNPGTNARLCLPTPGELHYYTFGKAIHCDGLLLSNCRIFEGGKYRNSVKNLAVWNPMMSRVTWIELSNSYGLYDVYGFGYDNVSRENYKILRINQGLLSSEIEIYEFKSKLWRSVDATLECDHMWDYVSMNGNMYWLARKKMVNSETESFIQCFRGDRLSLLHHHHTSGKIEVWLTSKLADGVVSWSKYLNVTHDPLVLPSTSRRRIHPTYFTHKTDKIMLLCEEEDFEEKYIYTNVYEIFWFRFLVRGNSAVESKLEQKKASQKNDQTADSTSIITLDEIAFKETGKKTERMIIRCKICNISTSSEDVMETHKLGKKHQARLKKQYISEDNKHLAVLEYRNHYSPSWDL
ncbi:unnamed protein product [Thlaspi arvense]|uniref:F-box domain-containing protein n=1 Tax=Thlaspi arvense TaxID=13288 RepID=A0AAU9SBY6_THLAR|nr:unnamed protein product [Thlaspi arvense]